jgi:O-antigen/teichoic acid export membrane protein
MKSVISTALKHPLISGSTIAFIGTFGSSILAYFFNLSMIRMLSVSDYGLLTALSSLTVVFGIFQVSLVGIFAKFSAKYSANDDQEGLSKLYTSGKLFVLIVAGILLLILVILSPLFVNFLKVPNLFYLYIIFFSIIASVLSAFPLGILQGKMKFVMTSTLYLFSAFIKVALGITLVVLGANLTGALIAILVSSLVPALIGTYVVRKNRKKIESNSINSSLFIKEFRIYSIYFFLASLGITIITNADIMLVRAFFNTEISGQYAALSLMGKAIFYFTSPIYFVFFPLIAQKNERNEDYTSILLLTVLAVLGITGTISVFYYMFPEFVLRVFAPPPEYRVLVPYIGIFSVYMLLFSIANIFNHLFLSLNKNKVFIINLFVAMLFICLISIFHSTLQEVINILLFSASLLLVLYVLYYYRVRNEKN